MFAHKPARALGAIGAVALAVGVIALVATNMADHTEGVQDYSRRGSCADATSADGAPWHDSKGNTCDWYNQNPLFACAGSGNCHEHEGKTAFTACCVCRDLCEATGTCNTPCQAANNPSPFLASIAEMPIAEMRRAGSGSGSGSGSSFAPSNAPSNAPSFAPSSAPTTAAPTPDAATTGAGQNVQQSAVIDSLSTCDDYVAAVASAYELGWAEALGLLQSGVNVLLDGVTVTSACGDRRAQTVGFTGFVPQTVIDDSSNSVTASGLSTGASATELQDGVTTVKNQDTAGTFTSVAVPTVSSTSTPTVTTVSVAPTVASSSDSDDDTGLLVGVIIGSVVGFAVLVAIAVLICKHASSAETVSGTSMEMGDTKDPTFVETQTTDPGVQAKAPQQL